MEYIFRTVKITGETITDEDKRNAVRTWLLSQGGEEPTEQVIDASLAEWEAERAIEAQAEQAKLDFRNLPGWAEWTGPEVADYLRANILNGMTKEQADAWIDANVGGANLAAVLVSVRTALKLLAAAVIDGRDVGHQNEARAIMFLRDICLK